MACKSLLIGFIWIVALLVVNASSWATLTIYTETAVEFELAGYDGLNETSLFKGRVATEKKQEIETSYRGLALLKFTEGQGYPVIIGDGAFGLHITGAAEPPSFDGSDENEIFYRRLSGDDNAESAGSRYDFSRLMIDAKQLLNSSYSIRTLSELTAKKEEFHAFVRDHYQSLKHSDMVRRLIAQYFMMHEYADYSSVGTPATTIKARYRQEVVDGVGNWLEVLRSHVQEYEVLNYCVLLYYQRNMVTLASLIVGKYQDVVYCPGVEKETWTFPRDLLVSEANGIGARQLQTIKGPKVIAFVSDDCPASMVETIIKVRQSPDLKENAAVIVVPLQQLSENHITMSRMVSSGKMFFLNDEKWRKENLNEKPKLPLFIRIGDI